MQIDISEKTKPIVSVIIPVRNEEENIARCLQSLSEQNISKDFFEVILVNDHSEDNTVNIAKRFGQQLNLKIFNLSEGETGKKEALSLGVKNCKALLFLTTDGDCVYSSGWIRNMLLYYRQHKDFLIAGPVYFHPPKSIFQRLLFAEQVLMNGVSKAGIGLNKPLMCSGANMLVEKEMFYDVGGYEFGKQLASGDDVFLLHAINRKWDLRVGFNNLSDCFVETSYPKSFKQFFNQRIRWAGKTKQLKSSFVFIVGVILTLSNLCFLMALPMIAYQNFFLIIVVVKIFLDVLFFYLLKPKKRIRFFDVLLLSIVFPFYSVIITLFSFKKRYEWKGRNLR